MKRIVDRPPAPPSLPSCKPVSYIYTPIKFSTQTSDPDPCDDALSYRFVFDNDTIAWEPPDTGVYTYTGKNNHNFTYGCWYTRRSHNHKLCL